MTFYDRNIPPASKQTVIVPPITNGICDPGWAQDAMQGFASQLCNCTYQGKQLLLGRGSDAQLVGTSYFSSIGAFDKIVYDDGNDQYYGITATAFCSLDLDAGTVTSIDTTSSSPGFTDICMFNGDVILAKGTYLYRYDGTNLYSCGSILNNITTPLDFGNYTDTDITSTGSTAIDSGTTGSTRTRIVNVQAVLKKTGTVSGEVYMEFSDGTNTYRSEKVNVDIGIGMEYSVVSFDMIDKTDLPASTSWTLSINASEADASNYISLAEISSVEQINLNGHITPRATSMTVFNGRLYCFMDASNAAPTENYPVYFSNYNNVDDFFSSSLDGMVQYGGIFYLNDDIHSQVTGIATFRHNLVVSGYAGGKTRTELRDENNLVITATTDAVQNQSGLLPTPSQVFLIHPKSKENNFAMYAWTGHEADLTMNPDLATMVATSVGDQWESSSDNLIAEIDDWADTLWLAHGEQDELFIYHIKSGQWTKFNFSYDVHGMSYVAGRMFIFGADGSVNEYYHGDVSATAKVVVKTKKLRVSHFTRMDLKELIWYIEHPGFTGQVTIISELGGFEKNYYISGDPPKPVRVRGVKDMSFTFMLSDVGITERTPVGDLVCLLAVDGRSIS